MKATLTISLELTRKGAYPNPGQLAELAALIDRGQTELQRAVNRIVGRRLK